LLKILLNKLIKLQVTFYKNKAKFINIKGTQITKNIKQILLRGYRLNIAYKKIKSIEELLKRVILI
jgi:hypothetical protein